MRRLADAGEQTSATAARGAAQALIAAPGSLSAADSVMRRSPQLGQKTRPLHENGTSRSM
jgi:hypothetical protein